MSTKSFASASEALGTMLREAICAVLAERVPLHITVTDAAGQSVIVSISLPPQGVAVEAAGAGR